jgi:hypothetical protein
MGREIQEKTSFSEPDGEIFDIEKKILDPLGPQESLGGFGSKRGWRSPLGIWMIWGTWKWKIITLKRRNMTKELFLIGTASFLIGRSPVE